MKALGIILVVIGLPLLIVPIIGVPLILIGIIVILSSVGSNNAEKTAEAIARKQAEFDTPAHHQTNRDDAKWQALVQYDDDIATAHRELEAYGSHAIEDLKTTYLTLNDKSKLNHIVADIKERHRR